MSTNPADLVERLAALPKLSGIPRSELEWLVAHGALERREAGGVFAPRGQRIENMWILLSGAMVIRVDRGVGPRQVMRWTAGDVTGMLPYSRMTGPPGDNAIEEPVEVLTVHERHFPEMVHHCPVITAHTVHLMLDRARRFNTSDLQDEKMVSLGRLAAGLAHELNNPASAATRSARLLRDSLAGAEAAARELGAAGLDEAQIAELERLRVACSTVPAGAVLSPLERADREDGLAGWLERHGQDTEHAAALADSSVSLEALDRLAATVPGAALGAVLGWIASSCATASLTDDIERAATRIHDLVAAVKRFTRMDQRVESEEVDVEEGLRDTLKVIGSKARGKSARVTLEVEEGLPAACAAGGELNQIWLNLVDNALDAIAEGGTVALHARRERDRVVVSVIDDGPGIPAEVLPRIFDPFFTTKPPGQGTGLGLDIARRLVRRWDGEITVESRPGRTEFRVDLVANVPRGK
ncbi:MAG TPA: ATP-binding protein [Thermoanaerobaculia bacterium]|nr:ATP-binding protein [Thermoanaerobaculia bacterium]